ncbi:MAG: carboxypeptidase regulatory-like domain-containing protein [Planctomycetes bacterium]|nr:carboxypeptidase regulatory-like domain-containing protein [Planctomycetota bacterium]
MSSKVLPWFAVGLAAAVTLLELASSPASSSAAASVAHPGAPAPEREPEQEALSSAGETSARRSAARTAPASAARSSPSTRDATGTLYTFELWVLDADDQPLPGAEVRLAPWPHPIARVGTTDARGRLRVQWRAARESMRVAFAASHPELGASSLRLAELTTRPFAAAIELRGGARPSASTPPGPELRARLDEDGLLRFPSDVAALPGEPIELPTGWSFPGATRAVSSTVPADVPQVHVGGVVREPDGDPVAGARVRASSPELEFELSTRSHADGAFTLGPLPRDGAHVSVGGGELGRYETELGAGVEPFQLLRPSLQRGRELHGRWRDALGRPLAGWRVELFDTGAKSPWADTAITDAEGRFTVPNVPATMLGLDLVAPDAVGGLPFDGVRGFWPEARDEFDAPWTPSERSTLVFRVVDAFGSLVDDADVRLEPVSGDRAQWVEFDPALDAHRAEGLPPGSYRLWVNAAGRHAALHPTEFELAPGDELDLGVVALEGLTPVVVELPARYGAAECRLETADTDPPLVLGAFRARGRFRVDLQAGAYTLHVLTSEADRAERVERFEVLPGRTRVVRLPR